MAGAKGRRAAAAEAEGRDVTIKELQAGSDLFRATGVSVLKVVRGGKAGVVRLPIKSSGVADVVDEIRKQEPKPPAIQRLIQPGTPEALELKLRSKQFVRMFDYTDETFLAEQRKFNENLSWAIVLQALDVPIKDERGEPVADRAKQIEILRGLGISTNQLSQLVDDVNDLTRLSDEDKEAFFGTSLDGEDPSTA